MRFDAVIFDLDGTLADALEDVADAVNRILRAERFPEHDYSAYELMIGRGIRNLVSEALPPDQRGEVTVERCFTAMIADYRENYLVRTRLYDGVAELLRGLRLRGVRLAVFSNKADDLTRRIVQTLIRAGTFEVVMGARPETPLKPDPAGALLIAQCMGLTPEHIVYVGDSGIDMLTAKRAGMIAVGASWGFRDEAELVAQGADLVIDHPLELLDLHE